jgi:large subunit ribosomal protein L10
LAISKEHKDQLVSQYGDLLKNSQAMIVAEYKGMKQQDLDTLRGKIREIGGEFHIVKNTLLRLAVKNAGLPVQEAFFEGSSAVIFALKDAPATAKSVAEFAKGSEVFKVKGGYLENKLLTAAGVKSLADMPPLPVMRAQFLGVLLAPASKLVRTLAEPARGLAAVIKAHAEPASA